MKRYSCRARGPRPCGKASPPNPADGPQEVEATSSESCASFRDAVSQVRAFETRVMARLDEMQAAAANQWRHELCTLESRVSANLEQHMSILMTKLDVCNQKVEMCSSYQIAKISDLASKLSEEGGLMTKLEVCNQKIEACAQLAEICGQKVETSSSDHIDKISDLASKFSEIVCEAGKASQARAGAMQAKVDALMAQTSAGKDLLAQKTEAVLASQRKMVDWMALEEDMRDVTVLSVAGMDKAMQVAAIRCGREATLLRGSGRPELRYVRYVMEDIASMKMGFERLYGGVWQARWKRPDLGMTARLPSGKSHIHFCIGNEEILLCKSI